MHVELAIDADAVDVSARDGAAQFVGLLQSAPTGANTLRSEAVMARPRTAACTSWDSRVSPLARLDQLDRGSPEPHLDTAHYRKRLPSFKLYPPSRSRASAPTMGSIAGGFVACLCLLSVVAAVPAAHPVSCQEPSTAFGARGTVLDIARRPVPDAEVRLVLETEMGARTADVVRTDESGCFLARGWVAQDRDRAKQWRLEIRATDRAVSVVDELFGGYGVSHVGTIYVFDPVVVRGEIRQSDGTPIRGVAVRYVHGDAEWSREGYALASPEALTAEDGGFSFRSAPPGQATLGFSARGYADRMVRTSLLDGPTNKFNLQLLPERPFSGIVLDPSGAPIAGARVTVSPRAFWRADEVTDAEGRFRIDGLGDDWNGEWEVRALGYFNAYEQAGTRREVELHLEPCSDFIVRVERDGVGPPPRIESITLLDSTPPGGCGLSYTSIEMWPEPTTVQIREPGEWRVAWESAVKARDTYFHGPVSGFVVSLADGSAVRSAMNPAGEATGPIVLRAHATGGITGRVIRSADNRPAPGVEVQTNWWSVTNPHVVVRTDDEGRFAFDGIGASSAHTLGVHDELWRGRCRLFAVAPGSTTRDIQLVIEPQPRIVGRVTVAGESPVDPVVIGLGEYQHNHVVEGGSFGVGISDAVGRFSVVPHYGRRLTIVPKKRTRTEDGGYRRFRSEFPQRPAGDRKRHWEVDAPWAGEVSFDFDMAVWE